MNSAKTPQYRNFPIVAVTMPPELIEAGRARAVTETTSFSALLRRALISYLSQT